MLDLLVAEICKDLEQSFSGSGRIKHRDRENEQLRRENGHLQAENAFLRNEAAGPLGAPGLGREFRTPKRSARPIHHDAVADARPHPVRH